MSFWLIYGKFSKPLFYNDNLVLQFCISGEPVHKKKGIVQNPLFGNRVLFPKPCFSQATYFFLGFGTSTSSFEVHKLPWLQVICLLGGGGLRILEFFPNFNFCFSFFFEGGALVVRFYYEIRCASG